MATLSAVLDEVSLEKTAVSAGGYSSKKRKRGREGNTVRLSECAFSRVVVYQDQAEVRRDLSCSLSEGDTTVRILGFPEVTDPDSVRVELKQQQQREGVVIISDVVYVSQYRVERETSPPSPAPAPAAEVSGDKVSNLSSSVLKSERDQLRYEKLVLVGRLSVLRREQKLACDLNAVVEGGAAGSSSEAMTRVKQACNRENLRRVVEFVESSCSRLEELERRVRALSEQLEAVARQLETIEMNEAKSGGRAQQQQQQLEEEKDEFVRAVEIVFESECAQNVEVLVSYVVSNASWSSLYHLRVSTEESSVQVHYFGQVKQWTGEDWVNTRISLSTASPSKGGNPPQLEPYNISRYYSQAYYSQSAFPCEYIPTMFDSYDPTIEDCYRGEEFSCLSQAPPMRPVEVRKSQVQTGMFTQTFNVLRPASIPSDSTEHKVSVSVIDLASSFENVCLPEQNSNVYLVAKATNTSEYPLLSGPCSVFMDNNFISKSTLKSVSPGEEVSCSLGVDPLVRVSLKAGDSYQSRQAGWISKGTVSEEYNKVTSVKNTKKQPISVKVVESVPVSEDERVRVHLLEPVCSEVGQRVGVSGGGSVTLNEKNHLEWCIQLEPTSQRKFLLNYIVEYPVKWY